MEVNIVRIGNSDGIVIPKSLMKRFSLKRSDVLVVDETAPVLTLTKRVEPMKYEGPNKGFFAGLSYHGSDDTSWGGNVRSEDYLAELRGIRTGKRDNIIMTRGYLLDTNTVIDMLKARRGVQRQVVEHGPQKCFISDITISELMTGYYLSGNPTEKKDIDFVKENFTLLRVTPSILDKFAEYRAALHKKGSPIPALDLIILATASVNELVPVSHDSHFSVFPELKREDWTEQ